MLVVIDERPIAYRYRLLAPHLTERELRLWAAAEASVHGAGAIAAVARVTGLSPATIIRAQRELTAPPPKP
jgi:DNA-binding MurR/RpiR family transcriptional regulator